MVVLDKLVCGKTHYDQGGSVVGIDQKDTTERGMNLTEGIFGGDLKRLKFLCLVVGFVLGVRPLGDLLAATAISGQAYFVATDGSDSNPCPQARSAATPKKTIGAALACLGEVGAGITVQVAPGVYLEAIDKLPSGSSWSNTFTLKCAVSRACTIRPGNRAAITMNRPSSYIEIRGFVIDGDNFPSAGGIYGSAWKSGDHHHVRIIDNELKNLGDMGIQVSGASDWEIQNNWIHHVGASCYSPGLCHAIYVADNTRNWILENNTINNSSAYGIHVYASIGGHVIRNNITHSNGTPGVNGSGILAGGTGGRVYGNISYSNADAGILLGHGCSGQIAYNNTIYNNKGHGMQIDCKDSILKNNLIVENSAKPIFMSVPSLTISNNIITGTAANHFVNAPGGNFKLISNSPAIDAGTPNISDAVILNNFMGRAPDVGAVETR